jgi:uncharacterized caspase-like protein
MVETMVLPEGGQGGSEMAASPRDRVRGAGRLAPALVLLGGLFVAGIAPAAERELGRHESLRAVVPGDFACAPQVTVTVRAPEPALFGGDRIALQKLVGGLRIMLGFECQDLRQLVLVGEAAGEVVYHGMASADSGWVLATLEGPTRAAEAEVEVAAPPSESQGEQHQVAAAAGADPPASDPAPAEPAAVGAAATTVLPPELPEAAAAQPERRVALVIGNGAYAPEIGPLANPANDAADMAEALRAAGFEVTLQLDVDRDTMLRAAIDFGSSLRDGGVGLFYYAGHAVQVDGSNYLIPLGAQIDREDYVPLEAVDVNQVLGRMGGADNRLNIVILDACRNNPFRGISRGVARGLAQTLAPTGTYIAYSAGPGQVALDGDGRNSPYTAGLLDMMRKPGLPLEEVFKGVRVQVLASTQEKQTPWTSSSITGDFYFRPPQLQPAEPQVAEPAGAAPAASDDLVVWSAIANSENPDDFEIFLDAYPQSPLAPFARQRLERLRSATSSPSAPAR